MASVGALPGMGPAIYGRIRHAPGCFVGVTLFHIVLLDISHIQIFDVTFQIVCGKYTWEYYVKYWQSHKTLLWVSIMLWTHPN